MDNGVYNENSQSPTHISQISRSSLRQDSSSQPNNNVLIAWKDSRLSQHSMAEHDEKLQLDVNLIY